MVADKTFYDLFSNYFRVHLPQYKKRSEHTIRSYRNALNALLDFVKAEKGVKLAEITLDMIDSKIITKYLAHLDEKQNSLTTRNLRLNCIKAFYAYAADTNPEATAHAADILKIPKASVPKYRKINYISEAAVNILLAQPDIKTKKGRRDRFFMLLMYDTGARLAEMRNIKIRDIIWAKNAQAALPGKGSKLRHVPITNMVISELKSYLDEFHPNADKYDDQNLFYIESRGHRYPLSDSIARKLVRDYGESAKKVCAEIPDIVRPHMLRHSRAMHLYQKGNDLTLIQQWLGHVKLETTLVYAYADTEHKRKAIEATIDKDSPLSKRRNADRFTITDDETIRKLYGLV